MILDKYFRRPLVIDYSIGVLTIIVLFILSKLNKISIPDKQDSYVLTGDLTNISLTLVGFILTILTVFITFKDNSKSINENSETFGHFFQTGYYYETIKHLKNCIKSIIIVSALGFFLRISLLYELRKFLFFFNVFGLIITILTVFRCLLILSRVLEFQKKE